MRIGVLSDTHDRLPTLRRAVAMFERLKVEAILHAGDYVAPFAAKLLAPDTLHVPLHCIYGNNDGEKAGLKTILPNLVEPPLRVELGGKTVAMHHFVDWFKPGETDGADVIVSGHDHRPAVETRDGQLFVNPGECCGWVTDRCTVAVLDLEAASAEIVEVHP